MSNHPNPPQHSLAKEKIKFLLLEGIHPQARERLEQAGYSRVAEHPATLPREALARELAEAHFLGIRSRTQIDAALLDAAPRLTAIGCFCIGTDQVDLAAAEARGIAVFNAPYANTRSVAELVIGEAIMLLRDIPRKLSALKRGEWLKSAAGCHEIRGKKLGIVGYGHIGTQTGLLAEALGMEVRYYDILPKLPLGNARPVVDLEAVLTFCDVLTLHVPDTPATRQMIGKRELEMMNRGSVLINASRGMVVDLGALHRSLQNGHLAGAALDVFPSEPKDRNTPFESPLCRLDQVLLTPHIGGSTLEAQANIAVEVTEKLVRYSDNGSTIGAVNLPEVAMPDHAGMHRILHIHRNEAGVLQQINRVFADSGANIAAQYLQTRGETGYVVMDIETGDTADLLEKLRAIPATIRCRVLY